MCGIVGVSRFRAVAPAIVEALERLEYRGYDSAGVATLEGGNLTRVRASGKLKNLRERLQARGLHGRIGIGHTRWRPMASPTRPTPIPTPARASPSSTTASSRISANCARSSRQRPCLRHRNDSEAVAPSRRGRNAPRRRAAGRRCDGAEAAQGRLRAGVPLRVRGGFADRRPPRLAARSRLGRQGRLSWLRRAGARPFANQIAYLDEGTGSC